MMQIGMRAAQVCQAALANLCVLCESFCSKHKHAAKKIASMNIDGYALHKDFEELPHKWIPKVESLTYVFLMDFKLATNELDGEMIKLLCNV